MNARSTGGARAASLLALSVLACSRSEPSGVTQSGASTSSAPVPAVSAGSAPSQAVAMDALGATGNGAADCTFGHRGVLLDFGDTATRSRLTATERAGRIDSVERDGATWARVFARGVSLPFLASADDVASATADGASPVIEARVRGGSAKSIAVFLNGKAAGIWPLAKGEARVVSLTFAPNAPNGPQLVAGTNEILLRFHGAARAGASAPDEEAEIDWIHVGGADRRGDVRGVHARRCARQRHAGWCPDALGVASRARLCAMHRVAAGERAPGHVRRPLRGWRRRRGAPRAARQGPRRGPRVGAPHRGRPVEGARSPARRARRERKGDARRD